MRISSQSRTTFFVRLAVVSVLLEVCNLPFVMFNIPRTPSKFPSNKIIDLLVDGWFLGPKCHRPLSHLTIFLIVLLVV
jgi:hypothetical protein